MVMFVILNGPLDRLDAEPKRSLHLHYEFVINRSSHSVVFIILILWLVEPIPGVLFQAFDAYAFVRVCHEDF